VRHKTLHLNYNCIVTNYVRDKTTVSSKTATITLFKLYIKYTTQSRLQNHFDNLSLQCTESQNSNSN